MTACGGGALPNDASIAPDTQNDACADNPLADGCQASAGFLSVNLDEDIGNQEAESSVAPVVNTPPAPTPVVKKTEPAPITSVDTSDFVPKTSASTQSAPAEQRSGSAVSGDSGASGQQSASVTAAAAFAGLDETRVLPTSQHGLVTNLADLSNKFLKAGWTHTQVASDVILFDQLDTKGNVLVAAGTPILPANIPVYAPIVRKNLNRSGLVLGDSLYMNLYNARYDGVAIGGDAVDGIDFYTVSTLSRTGSRKHLGGDRGIENTIIRTVSRFHYAGILAGTDLGAPVSTTDPTAIWNGSFRTDDARYPVDFQLTVTFGTTNDTRTISAFVKDTATRAGVNDYYLLAGNYDANGLITGTVNYGEFTGGERNAPTGDRTPGTIQGLIGVEGAVGVFMSDVAESTATVDLTGATTFTNGYVGGFVAAPSDIATGNPDVTFSDWTRDTARSATLNTVTRANEFLAGGAFGLRTTGAINLPTQENALRGIISRADCDAYNTRFAGKTIITTTAGTYTVMNNHPLDDTSVVKTPETPTTSPTFSTRDCDLTDIGSLNLATATHGADIYDDEDNKIDNRISKVARGGVAFFRDGDQSYAGLLSGTDLGAPLTATDTVGKWHGQFKSIGAYYFNGDSSTGTRVDTALDLEFTLTVNFGGVSGKAGSVSAFVPIDEAGRHFYLTGTYDDKGVISGYVQTANFKPINGSLMIPTEPLTTSTNNSGVLTGLIGAHGAVGAFVSDTDNYNYAGGFVAAYIPGLPNYNTFKRYYSEQTGNRALPAEIKSDAGAGRGFLQGTATGLVETGFTLDTDSSSQAVRYDRAHFSSIAVRLNEATSGDDGFAVLSGTTSGARFAVGLLSGTDLGAPLQTEAEANVEWTGSLHYANTTTEGLTKSADALTLIVNVNDGTLTTKTRVEVSVGATGTRTIAINGRFGTYLNERLESTSLPVGILGGTVSLYDAYTGGIKGADSPLIGLIGAEGVLGVFITSSLVGGFEAASGGVLPTGMKQTDGGGDNNDGGGDTDQVLGELAYQDWASSFASGGVNAELNDNGSILRNSGYATPAGVNSVDFIRLDASNNIVATSVDPIVHGTPLRLFNATQTGEDGFNSGAVFGVGGDSDNRIYQLYAGLLPGTNVTDLGAPLTDDTKDGNWTGTLAGYDLAGIDIFDTSFALKVTFGTAGGTITSKSTGGLDVYIAGNNIGIYFNGQFNDRGVISGTANQISLSDPTQAVVNGITGTFNGLIGANGAVGAFKGINADETKGYVGGFQVEPPTE